MNQNENCLVILFLVYKPAEQIEDYQRKSNLSASCVSIRYSRNIHHGPRLSFSREPHFDDQQKFASPLLNTN